MVIFHCYVSSPEGNLIAEPQEWVLCLSDERVAQALCPEMAREQSFCDDEVTGGFRFVMGKIW